MIKRIVLVMLALSALSCTLLVPVTATRVPTPTAKAPAGTATPAHEATATPAARTRVPSPTATPWDWLATSMAPHETPSPEQVEEWVSVFTAAWEDVRDNYIYPDFNGVDWNAVYDEFLPRVESAQNADEFYDLMHEMFDRLADDHSRFLSPEEVAEDDRATAGEADYVGIGVRTSVVTDTRAAVIELVFPDSPAERGGLRPHDSILAVNGNPVIDDAGASHMHDARGPEGTPVTITVKTPGGTARDVVLIRAPLSGQAPVVTRRLDGDIGYLLVPAFDDLTIGDRTDQALEDLTAEGPALKGLILDLRVNYGGALLTAQQVLGLFTKGTVGYFVSKDSRWPMVVPAHDIGGSQDIPLVILVGRGTASFGEVFAGILQAKGRAQVVGMITDGNVEVLLPHEYSDGSRAWIAENTFELPNGKQNWEDAGIIPDVIVNARWDEFTEADDPQIRAAWELLSR